MRFTMKEYAVTGDLNKEEAAEMLSLWGSAWSRGPWLQSFFKKCQFSNLFALFMRNFSERDFDAFGLPITIKVLDLSDNQSLGNLLLIIGRFVNLEYLNVSNSMSIKLPEQLKELKKLRYLLLNDIRHLEVPREGVICHLLSLQVFSMLRSHNPYCDESVLLYELENLKHLQDIRISVYSSSSFKQILTSPKLQESIYELDASCVFCKSSLQMFGRFLGEMEHLETLVISDKSNTTAEGSEAENILKGFFQGLKYTIPLCKLVINKWKIFDLDWVKLAPKLEYLELYGCDLLEEVFTGDYFPGDDLKRFVFRRLTKLTLTDLPSLRSICSRALKFPYLEVVCVSGCPNLRKLPFNRHSALKNLKHFKGEPNFVDWLEWEDEFTENLFLEKYEPF